MDHKQKGERKMKKYLYLIALALATFAQADFWDNCTTYGGNIITANSYGNDKGGLCNDPSDPTLTNNCNGKRFCHGEKKMNWWSAFTWCEAIGGKLASWESLCPGTQPLTSITCANIKGISSKDYYGYSSLGKDTDYVFEVNLSTGTNTNYKNGYGKRAWTAYGTFVPVCEE